MMHSEPMDTATWQRTVLTLLQEMLIELRTQTSLLEPEQVEQELSGTLDDASTTADIQTL